MIVCILVFLFGAFWLDFFGLMHMSFGMEFLVGFDFIAMLYCLEFDVGVIMVDITDHLFIVIINLYKCRV